MSGIGKGLGNKLGQYNCFLNVVIQTLWNVTAFREAFQQDNGSDHQHKHQQEDDESACIFCALKTLFLNYEYGDAASLPPDTLRVALSHMFEDERRFQIGEMDDACEAHEAILDALHATAMSPFAGNTSEVVCSPPCLVHRVFGLSVCEQQVCPCGTTSEPRMHTSFVFYATATSLLESAVSSKCRISRHLRALSEEEHYPCPDSGCKKRAHTARYLFEVPAVFTLGLTWSSDSVSREDVEALFDILDGELNLADLYTGVSRSIYKMSGLVCYYGRHYHCAFFLEALNAWYLFDDEKVTEIGPTLHDLRKKCVRGRLQPALIFYTRESSVISDDHGVVVGDDSDSSSDEEPAAVRHASPVTRSVRGRDLQARQEFAAEKRRTQGLRDLSAIRDGDEWRGNTVHRHEYSEMRGGRASSSSHRSRYQSARPRSADRSPRAAHHVTRSSPDATPRYYSNPARRGGQPVYQSAQQAPRAISAASTGYSLRRSDDYNLDPSHIQKDPSSDGIPGVRTPELRSHQYDRLSEPVRGDAYRRHTPKAPLSDTQSPYYQRSSRVVQARGERPKSASHARDRHVPHGRRSSTSRDYSGLGDLD